MTAPEAFPKKTVRKLELLFGKYWNR